MSAFKAWLTGCALLEGGGALRWGPGEGVRALVCVLQRVIGSHPSPLCFLAALEVSSPAWLCAPTVMCCLTPGPDTVRPSNHELKPLKPEGDQVAMS